MSGIQALFLPERGAYLPAGGKMKRIIIGIHGLKNKPPEKILREWWKDAIAEGFEKNGYRCGKFRFDLVYWADLNYESPQDPDEGDENDPRYLTFPYQGKSASGQEADETASVSVREKIRRSVRKTIETGLDLLFLRGDEISGIDKIADIAIKRMFSDLDVYFRGECLNKPGANARKEFRSRLSEKLRKYRRYEIMLVAHSMGSIIAYDTLYDMGKRQDIDYFVTIGSPLGIPVVIKKILKEQGKGISGSLLPSSPDAIVKGWYNLSDLDDRIALVYNLEKEFAPSVRGIRPADSIVRNNYYYKGKSNPHKVYGYLQCPEFSEIAFRFLTEEPGWKKAVRKIFGRMRKFFVVKP